LDKKNHACKELWDESLESGWKFKMMNRMRRHLEEDFFENLLKKTALFENA
jgi:hypothetical protein